ncbi:hypothetical protein [Actinoplanes sp. NPDC051851]|uniref:hypothetical protein n=1 Tax=Actinoplanes sp. NPDC051851 TaxID=3154753 RepID=UPI00342E0E0B
MSVDAVPLCAELGNSGCRQGVQVRASRFAVALGAGERSAVLVLETEADLAWAIRRWLVGMVAFDRRDGCWVWLDHDEELKGLIVGEINEDLTDPQAVVQAQQWAAEVLRAGETGHRFCDQPACDVMSAPLRITEWRTVWFAGIRHYAPLFASTMACLVPASDLDPATGAECRCTERSR